MADYKVTDTELTSVANAIRAKTGKSAQMEFPTEFVSEIGSISGGGGSTNILGGTTVPTSTVGSDGDIYIKYTDYGASETIPTGYTPLKCLQSTGTQYITTDFIPSVNTEIEIKLNFPSINSGDRGILGSAWALNGLLLMTNGNTFKWHSASAVNSSAILDNTDYVVSVDNSSMTVNGNTYNVNPASSVSSNALSIFEATTGTDGRYGIFKLYYCRIFDNDILVRDLAPVKRNSDDEIGLYDIVNDIFYANSGTGTFIAGEEALGTPIDNVYLKVNGAWIIIEDGDWDDVNTGGE